MHKLHVRKSSMADQLWNSSVYNKTAEGQYLYYCLIAKKINT